MVCLTLPPGSVSRPEADMVSPASGRRATEKTRSAFADPRTTMGL